VGPSADHYALAVVAYEMLTGSVPFSADTPLAVLLAHMQRPLPLPRSINPDLSERVEEVLLKGLAKTPPDRYPTASAFVAGLVEASRASLQPAGPRQWSDRARERPTDGSTPSASPRAGRVLPFNTAWLPRISVNRLRSTLHQLPRPSLTPPWVAGLAVAAMGVVAVGGVFLARGPLSRGGPSSPAEVSAAASAGGTLAGIPAGSGPTEPTTIILQDDFQNPSAGRLPPSSEVPWAANGYESGEYAIKADVYAPLPSAARIPGSYDTVWLSVDARIVGPTTTRTVILQCRAAALNGYQLEIEPDHSGFAVYRLDAGRKTPIVRPGTSDAIRTGNQTNRVELGCVGNTITARVNGTVLGSAEDGTYPHGSAFLATAAPGATSEVRFDNLLVKGHRLD
jgi:hypothetical protein